MNRIILIAALIIISQSGRVFAQNDEKSWREKRWSRSKTEKTFNMFPGDVNIKDYAYLRNGTMILELTNVDDFDRLKNLDSILARFRKDIAFYNDSLEKNPGNVRIDYAVVEGHEFSQIRVKKHIPDGEFYVNRDDEISKLKLEQDTVRIVMHVKGKEIELIKKMSGADTTVKFRPQYTIQVTFCLDNYKDIDKIIADREMLRHAIDTLRSTKTKRTTAKPFINASTSLYRPYSGLYSLTRLTGIVKSDYFVPWNVTNRRNKITLGLNMGMGLIRNTLAPMAEIGLGYLTHGGYRNEDYYTSFQVSMTPYFFFDRNPDGQFFIKDNWFVNAEIASPGEIFGLKTKQLGAGIGYLAVPKGDYFKGTTMKAFLSIKLKAAFTISPEIIFTNNFKQIFPGITLRIF